MFDINVIVAINNIPEAKARFNKGGLNAIMHMGFGSKTYPSEQIKEKNQKKEPPKKLNK